jgi:hypothetical protein
MSQFSLNQLTEGIQARHLGAQNRHLLEKWTRTGLLRGMEGTKRENMARMLENQASQMLKEASSLGGGDASAGDIRGFSNIAFPIVRRVFGNLIANELVSIQPMSLPSGLLFYLDYTYGTSHQSGAAQGSEAAYSAGQSIYNSPVGRGVRSGSLANGGQYDLAGAGYSRGRKSADIDLQLAKSGFTFSGTSTISRHTDADPAVKTVFAHATGTDGKLLQFDPQITKRIEADSEQYFFAVVPLPTDLDKSMIREAAVLGDAALADASDFDLIPGAVQGGNCYNVKRLNQVVSVTRSTPGNNATTATAVTVDPLGGDHILLVLKTSEASHSVADGEDAKFELNYVVDASLNAGSDGSTLVSPAFESAFSSNEPGAAPAIPEIDIKIESIAVTAVTRKLKARWSPELAQDLNAYHSLDAEVELTQILSEQVALEIDREILGDLLHGANAANLYWSRAPGKFVKKNTGAVVTLDSSLNPGPTFTGTVREWYETLIETIIDVANQIHRKTLRGSANFIVVSPDVATLLEASVFYRPSLSIDGDGQVGSPMSIGAEKTGTLSNRFTVYKDPYFPRNKILVGFKGGSYLESGYVYAPYVPLIVTPTIFAPEDFTPRKGVMTRYGKKMVRSDFFGTVTIMDLDII